MCYCEVNLFCFCSDWACLDKFGWSSSLDNPSIDDLFAKWVGFILLFDISVLARLLEGSKALTAAAGGPLFFG